MNNKKDPDLDFDKILNHIGPLEWWRYSESVFFFLVGMTAGIGVVVFAMTGYEPNYRCVVPQCEKLNATSYYQDNNEY